MDFHAGIVATGGGMQAVSWLLSVPGASQTIVEANIPYAEGALSAFAPGIRGSAVSVERACDLADRAFDMSMSRSSGRGPIVGASCTAALTTNRERSGEEEAYICVRDSHQRLIFHIGFDKGTANRLQQDTWVSLVLLNALMESAGLEERLPISIGCAGRIERMRDDRPNSFTQLVDGGIRWILCHQDGEWQVHGEASLILFPGSFHPMHRGHERLTRLVDERTGGRVDLELSIHNTDKPSLHRLDVTRRLDSIQGRRRVLLTQASTFLAKSRLFPGRTFLLGFDTVVRLIDPKYYGGSDKKVCSALDEIRSLGCRFLVAGREKNGRFLTVSELKAPTGYADLFEGIPESDFRDESRASDLRVESEGLFP